MNMTDLCQEIKNWFDIDRQFGVFKIENGTLALDTLQEGQFFRIVGSVFNDGVYQYPATNLKNETFDGAIWSMAVPPEFILIVDEINAWLVKNADALSSPYQSESFGGYSYSKSSGRTNTTSKGDDTLTWQSHFAGQLNKWRKV